MAQLAPADDLSDEQRAVVGWGAGPLMVLAGAGTGKTTVIVERVRRLLATEPGLTPEQVLVLTYNVRAAGELAERFERRLGITAASRLTVTNFHAFGYRVLREHGTEIGLPAQLEVLDDVGQLMLLAEVVPSLKLVYHAPAVLSADALRGFAAVISRAKDELVGPAAFHEFADRKRAELEAQFGAGAYQRALADLPSVGERGPAAEVRRALRSGSAEAVADREARRQLGEAWRPAPWGELDPFQQARARQLAGTLLRDAAALEVLRLEEEALVYARYQDALRQRGAVDFGEQIRLAAELFQGRPNVLLRYQRRYRHILVDEFQDANIAQILLLELLAQTPERPANVVVVGDDDQSIYRFRGASYAAFEQFASTFGPDVPRLPLLLNRRSTGRILSVAERLISANSARLKSGSEGRLRSTHETGRPVELIYALDEADEAEAIVAWVKATFEALPERIELPDGARRARRWSDVAVLYRQHRHRELLVDRLQRAGIPYAVLGGAGVFARQDVRDVEAALRVMVDPSDSVACARLLAAGPWRLDAIELARLTRAARADGIPVYEMALRVLRQGEIAIELPVSPPHAGDPLEGSEPPEVEDSRAGDPGPTDGVAPVGSEPPRPLVSRIRLEAGLRTKLERLAACFDDLVPRAYREPPRVILDEYLARTGLLEDLLAVGTPTATRSVLALARLMRFVAEWGSDRPRGTLADFVGFLDRYQAIGGDLAVEAPDQLDVDGVQLMTIYQAKGLEYEAVVIPRLTKGQFPVERDQGPVIPVELLRQKPPEEFAVEEERRLLFVAMTRARTRLLVTTVDGPGGTGRPSPFVGELVARDAFGDLTPLDDLLVERRSPELDDGLPEALPAGSEDVAAGATVRPRRLMPLPAPFERRTTLRRRALELIGALEGLDPADLQGRAQLTDELVAVATDAAGAADEARRAGLDPLTLGVLARHEPGGARLLELAPLPSSFSHSQFRTYDACPLRYAFDKVYRIPPPEAHGFFEFGTAVHEAFEAFTRERRERAAAGEAPPDLARLQAHFEAAFDRGEFESPAAVEEYRARSVAVLERFYARELASPAAAVGFELPFTMILDPGDGSSPVRFSGQIDRIDRHPDGTFEIVDYKTGRARSQADVDHDDQLSAYALACREGAVRDPETGTLIPTPSRLTLYFTESDLALSTTRTDQQLDAFRERVLATAARIRGGDLAATPGYMTCRFCDFRRLCPSRYREELER